MERRTRAIEAILASWCKRRRAGFATVEIEPCARALRWGIQPHLSRRELDTMYRFRQGTRQAAWWAGRLAARRAAVGYLERPAVCPPTANADLARVPGRTPPAILNVPRVRLRRALVRAAQDSHHLDILATAFKPIGALGAQTEDLELLPDALGAPKFYNHPHLHVSITHSGSIAVSVVASHPLGIDLERLEERPSSLARYFFTADEQSWVERDAAHRTRRYNEVWTRKEAVAKLLGVGGRLAFKKVPVLDGIGPWRILTATTSTHAISWAEWKRHTDGRS